jgi:hypothetical protein
MAAPKTDEKSALASSFGITGHASQYGTTPAETTLTQLTTNGIDAVAAAAAADAGKCNSGEVALQSLNGASISEIFQQEQVRH